MPLRNAKSLGVLVATVALALTGCVGPQKPQMTPLEIQSLQTREYEMSEKIVFSSVMSVFQNLGYTVKSADRNTGFINAESATQDTTSGLEIFASVLSGVPANARMEQTAATAFIEKIGERTRVRLNFVVTNQSSSMYGQNARKDTPILDVKIYTNAFEKLENEIFVRSGE